jgi:urease accessory protein
MTMSSVIQSDPSTPCLPQLPRVHGRLRLRFETAGESNQTFLATSEQQLPLRIVRAFRQADGGSLVHLHNLSGGVLAGDRLELKVEVGPRAVVQLTTTGATRIYRSAQAAALARQTIQIEVEDDGLLEYLPDQLIPFAGSRYRQETEIVLGRTAGLFWWETIAPGREARNEVFAYEMLQLKTSIIAGGEPLALRDMKLEPTRRSLFSLARFGHYRYLSSFYICRTGIEPERWRDLEKRLAILANESSQPSKIVWGVSPLRAHGLVVKALSVKGRDIAARLPDFWRAGKRCLYDKEAVLPRKIY